MRITDSLFLKEIRIHSDWFSFLSDGNQSLVKEIEEKVQKTGYTPPADKVLRFLSCPLSSVRVLILGQDPYPQPGVATGRAFEVATLKSWNQPFKNISLKNILRSLYKAYTGKILTYNQLKGKFDNEFPVLPPGRLFTHWENQGVLLLNTSFTCQPGKPGSHQKLWEEFTSRLLFYIQSKIPNATWFLWGNNARTATRKIELTRSIKTLHPMMCYDLPGRDNDFLYGRINCFEPFIDEIDWTGYILKKGEQTSSLFF
jgi:uracil-DNA glycosylase